MDKNFALHEESFALKELGFDEPCLAWFSDRSIRIVGVNGCALSSLPVNSNFNGDDEFVTAPLYSQVFRWFREKYNIDSFVKHLYKSTIKVGYYFGIDQYKGVAFQTDFDAWYQTYEEAELACLKKLIEIVKNNE